jgi:F-box protein, helicase, 18
MELTPEQQAIVRSTGDIKVNAVAGSGKTSTLIAYAAARPRDAKILYLAFNRSVKLEAAKKFADRNLQNVRVETAHSLAYGYIVRRHGYTVSDFGYSTTDTAEMLSFNTGADKHAVYVAAMHINRFVAFYCNSDKETPDELNYTDTVHDKNARIFVRQYYNYLLAQTKLFLSRMDKGEIPVTHDFYLKKFQLSAPELNYDYILFDEGQDASPATLDVFMRQEKAVKVIVGDTHQQIYSWRYAVNSLEKAGFAGYDLSASFRFDQDLADLAKSVIGWKSHFGLTADVALFGKGGDVSVRSRAVIGRTNLGLLQRAIYYVIELDEVKQLYFEGNFSSYTYADDGASLYDVLNLSLGKRYLIRNKLIKSMNNLEELEDYIDKTGDLQLRTMVAIVQDYGERIPGILKTIRERHVQNHEKEKAQMIFSTVHRCKGMEYDSVELADDFTNEASLLKLKKELPPEKLNLTVINEEINLVYVAITRTRCELSVPKTLFPAMFGEATDEVSAELPSP